jgi:hypothetical protein
VKELQDRQAKELEGLVTPVKAVHDELLTPKVVKPLKLSEKLAKLKTLEAQSQPADQQKTKVHIALFMSLLWQQISAGDIHVM